MHTDESTHAEVAASKLRACATVAHAAADAIDAEDLELADELADKAGAKLLYAAQEIAAARGREPTARDYLDGRARFTSVAEWARTGRRLDWR